MKVESVTPLKVAIENCGLKQVWVAKKAGIHPSLMSEYVTGRRIPGALNQEKIASVLGRNKKDLFPVPMSSMNIEQHTRAA